MGGTEWKQGEVLAWSRHDGPGDAPRAPGRWLLGGVAGALSVTFVGIVGSDTLCPDHRAWVQMLGSVALVTSVVAVAQVLRNQASAALLALVAAGLGVAIGLLDAVHSPTRGSLILLGFAVAAVGSAIVSFRLLRLGAWDQRLAVAHRAPDVGPVARTSPTAADGARSEPARPVIGQAEEAAHEAGGAGVPPPR